MEEPCQNESCRNLTDNYQRATLSLGLLARKATRGEENEKELKQIKEQMAELNILVDSLRSKNYQLQSQEKKAQEDCERAKSREQDLAKQLDILEKSSALLKKKVEQQDEITSKYLQAGKVVEAIHKKRLESDERLKETNNALRECKKEKDDLKNSVENLKTEKNAAMARLKLYKKQIPNLFKLIDELLPHAPNLSYHTKKRIETFTSPDVRAQLLQGIPSTSQGATNHEDTSDEDIDDIAALISGGQAISTPSTPVFKMPARKTPEKPPKRSEMVEEEPEPALVVPIPEPRPSTSRRQPPVFEPRGRRRAPMHNVEEMEKAVQAKLQQKLTRSEEESEKRPEIAGGHSTIHGKKGPTVREQQSGMMSVKEKVAMMREEEKEKRSLVKVPLDQPSTSKEADPPLFEGFSPPRKERQRTVSDRSQTSDVFGLRMTPSPSASPSKTTPSGSLQSLVDDIPTEPNQDLDVDIEIPAYELSEPLEAGLMQPTPSMPHLDVIEPSPVEETPDDNRTAEEQRVPAVTIAPAPSMPHLEEMQPVEERAVELTSSHPESCPTAASKPSPKKVQFQIFEKSEQSTPLEPLTTKAVPEKPKAALVEQNTAVEQPKSVEVAQISEKTPEKGPQKERIFSPTTQKALRNMKKLTADLDSQITPLKSRPGRPQAPKAKRVEAPGPSTSSAPVEVQEEEEILIAAPITTKRKAHAPKEQVPLITKPDVPKAVEKAPEPPTVLKSAPQPSTSKKKTLETSLETGESQKKATEPPTIAEKKTERSQEIPGPSTSTEKTPIASSVTPQPSAVQEELPKLPIVTGKEKENPHELLKPSYSSGSEPPIVPEQEQLETPTEHGHQESPRTAISKMMDRIKQNAVSQKQPTRRAAPKRRKTSVKGREDAPPADEGEPIIDEEEEAAARPSTSRRMTRASSRAPASITKRETISKPIAEVSKAKEFSKQKKADKTVGEQLEMSSDEEQEEVISPSKRKAHLVSSSDEEDQPTTIAANVKEEQTALLILDDAAELQIALSDDEEEAEEDKQSVPQPSETAIQEISASGPSKPVVVPAIKSQPTKRPPIPAARKSLMSQVEKTSKALAKRLQSASAGTKRPPPARKTQPMKIPTVAGKTAQQEDEEPVPGPSKQSEEKKAPLRGGRAAPRAEMIEAIPLRRTARARKPNNIYSEEPASTSRPSVIPARQLKRKAEADIFAPKKMKTTALSAESILQKALDLGCDEQEITKKMGPEELEQIKNIGAERFAEIMMEYVIRMNRVDMWHSVANMFKNQTPSHITNSLEENLLQISYTFSADDADVLTPFIRKLLLKMFSKAPLDDLLCHKIVRLVAMGYHAQMQISSSAGMTKDLKSLVTFMAFYRPNVLGKALVYMVSRLPMEFLVEEEFVDVKKILVLHSEDHVCSIFNFFWEANVKKSPSIPAITLPTRKEVEFSIKDGLHLPEEVMPLAEFKNKQLEVSPDLQSFFALRAVYFTTAKTIPVLITEAHTLNKRLEELAQMYRIGNEADEIVGSLFGSSSSSSLKDPSQPFLSNLAVRATALTSLLDTVLRVTTNIGQDKQKALLFSLSKSAEIAHDVSKFLSSRLSNAPEIRVSLLNTLRAFIRQCQILTRHPL